MHLSEIEIDKLCWLCYEANRAMCQFAGDKSNADWLRAPHGQRESLAKCVKAILKNPELTPSDNHKNWVLSKIEQDASWGPITDMVPYDELCDAHRLKHVVICAIVKAYVCSHGLWRTSVGD